MLTNCYNRDKLGTKLICPKTACNLLNLLGPIFGDIFRDILGGKARIGGHTLYIPPLKGGIKCPFRAAIFVPPGLARDLGEI